MEGKNRQENIYCPIEEIEIEGRKIPDYIYSPMDEIEITGKNREDNSFEALLILLLITIITKKFILFRQLKKDLKMKFRIHFVLNI